MHKFRWLKPIVILFFLFSCGKSLPTLEGVDEQLWKQDKNGCTNKRSSMLAAIKNEKSKLLALDEMQIVEVLGKPDRNELFKRNQKFFYYFVEPSTDCENHPENPEKLIIRFNAMGLAKEISVEK